MAYLYHGTHTGGIKVLEPRSILHGTNESVVYLTGNRVYGLFYIWDREHTMGPAYITAGIVKGRVIYEEQFPNQLECFYKGVSGWLYTVVQSAEYLPVQNREDMFYSSLPVAVEKAELVEDVYSALTACETAGTLQVRRYLEQPVQRQQALTDKVAEWIRQTNFFAGDPAQRAFMMHWFRHAWMRAQES